MKLFGLGVLAAITGLVVFFCLLVVASRGLISLIFAFLYKRITTDRYWSNLFETYNLAKKIGLDRLVEAELRSAHGQPPERPFGRRNVVSPWQDLYFNPVYFYRQPLLDYTKIGTEVVIGPEAKYPLKIRIPVLIGGMAYGTALSAKTKQALALGATMAGTAANTGNGPFLPAERAAAEKLIIQYARGSWAKDMEVLQKADAVEIQLGQGLWGPAPAELSPRRLARNPQLRHLLGVKPGEKAVIPPRLLEVKTNQELKELVRAIRAQTEGVPVGFKLGATQWLERELEILVQAKPDFIAIDGMEGGTHGGLGSSLDALGTPTLYALVRARRFLDEKNLSGRISLLIGGGLYTGIDFLKALALGADAVFIGTIALLALVHTQAVKVLPWEPPTKLIYEGSKQNNKLNIDQGAQSLANFLKAAVQEMQVAALCLGKEHLSAVDKTDLSTPSRELAAYLGIRWCGDPVV
ncbi:MAG TPA: FMN-binding glutamate synthase family protein [Firmicutes bacterium]|nr:FMN-binding glutamate synthase family protein [Bacillota bacterium]